MGIRVHFYLAPPEGLSTLILEHIELFAVWFEDLHLEYPDEFPLEILQFTKQIKRDGIAALQAQTIQQSALVDKFVIKFCLSFDESYRILKPANESWVYSSHYWNSRSWLEVHCSPIFETLWMFMFTGRGIERDSDRLPFIVEEYSANFAYWTSQECVKMLNELQPLTIPEVEPTFCVRIVREALQTAVDQQASIVILVN